MWRLKREWLLCLLEVTGGWKMASLGTGLMFWAIIEPLLPNQIGLLLIIGGGPLTLWGINPF